MHSGCEHLIQGNLTIVSIQPSSRSDSSLAVDECATDVDGGYAMLARRALTRPGADNYRDRLRGGS
jgi:hypothetical protein